MSSCKVSKVETQFEIKSNAERYYDVYVDRPHHIPNMITSRTRANLPKVVSHQDSYSGGTKVGALSSWHYFIHDAKAKVANVRIGAIDRENKSLTYEVIGGDILEHYKSFNFILQVTTQNGDQTPSSVVHWALEYEKIDDSVPEPHALLQLVSAVSKDLDAHLSKTT